MKIVGLIPARQGSKRIPNKNVKEFFGHPLMAYTIQVAKDAGVFDELYVSTDSYAYGNIAREYGVPAVIRDRGEGDTSMDIDWIKNLLSKVKHDDWDAIAILRPTNPFRSIKMLKDAKILFEGMGCDSLRAMQLCKEHPCKAWRTYDDDGFIFVRPQSLFDPDNLMHEKQYQSLPETYTQNGSLELVKLKTLKVFNNLTGVKVAPLVTKNYEGFDINTPEDWMLAEALVNKGWVKLREVKREKGI